MTMKKQLVTLTLSATALFAASNAMACAMCVDLFSCEVKNDPTKTVYVGGRIGYGLDEEGREKESGELSLQTLKLNVPGSDEEDHDWYYLEALSDKLRAAANSAPETLTFAAVNADGKAAQIKRTGATARLTLIGDKIQAIELSGCENSKIEDSGH